MFLENSVVLTVLLVLGWVIVALPFIFGAFILYKIYAGRDKEAAEARKTAEKEAKEAKKLAKEEAKNAPVKIRKSATSLAPVRNRIESSRNDVMKKISETDSTDNAQVKKNMLDDLLSDEFDALPAKKNSTNNFPPPPPKLGL